jgi:hypothetical protein
MSDEKFVATLRCCKHGGATHEELCHDPKRLGNRVSADTFISINRDVDPLSQASLAAASREFNRASANKAPPRGLRKPHGARL